MSKHKKLLKKLKSKPKEMSRDEVINILEKYNFNLDFKRGSHIVVQHEKLKNLPGYTPLGELTIPVRNGRYVIRVYLIRIINAIEIIESE